MSERPKERASKAREGQPSAGSNPAATALAPPPGLVARQKWAQEQMCYMTYMGSVGVRALQQHASEVVPRAAAGEIVEITDRGRPVARLVPTASLSDLLAEARQAER